MIFCDISNDCAGGNVQRNSKKLKIIAVCKVKQISSFVRGKPEPDKKSWRYSKHSNEKCNDFKS